MTSVGQTFIRQLVTHPSHEYLGCKRYRLDAWSWFTPLHRFCAISHKITNYIWYMACVDAWYLYRHQGTINCNNVPCYHCESTLHTKSLHSPPQSARSTWEVALPHFWVYGIMIDYCGRLFTFVTINKILFGVVANFSIITYLCPWKNDLNRCMLLQLLLSCKLTITVIKSS